MEMPLKMGNVRDVTHHLLVYSTSLNLAPNGLFTFIWLLTFRVMKLQPCGTRPPPTGLTGMQALAPFVEEGETFGPLASSKISASSSVKQRLWYQMQHSAA